MRSLQIRRIAGTSLMILAALCLALIALAPIMLGSLGMDIHWTASRELVSRSALIVCLGVLLVIPCTLYWLGFRLRRPRALLY